METVDLKSKICPFVVVQILREVDNMEPGQKKIFQVCDPLAIKSVPEELDEEDDLEINIIEAGDIWEIEIIKNR